MRMGFVALLTGVALALMATPAMGQPRRPEGPPPEGGELAAPPHGEAPSPRGRGPLRDKWKDKDISELVEMVMMVRLSNELELSDEETVLLVRRIGEAKKRGAELARERSKVLKDLRSSVQRGDSDEDIEKNLDDLIAVDAKIQSLRFDAFNEAAEDLTVTQRAKLYVFVQEFEANLRKMIAEARSRAGGSDHPMAGRHREQMMPRRQAGPPQGQGPGASRRSGPPEVPAIPR
ncbi:MAG: hypothetical protein GY851_23485 [bacterium]|nr:hypothetical protein [bacterium]